MASWKPRTVCHGQHASTMRHAGGRICHPPRSVVLKWRLLPCFGTGRRALRPAAVRALVTDLEAKLDKKT